MKGDHTAERNPQKETKIFQEDKGTMLCFAIIIATGRDMLKVILQEIWTCSTGMRQADILHYN